MKQDFFKTTMGDMIAQSEDVHEAFKNELKDSIWISPETGESEDLNVSHELMDRDLEILTNRIIYHAAKKAYTLEMRDEGFHVKGKSLMIVADEEENIINAYFGYDSEDELKNSPDFIFGYGTGWVDAEGEIKILNNFGEVEIDGTTVNLDHLMLPIYMSALGLWKGNNWKLDNPGINFYVYGN